MIRTSLLIAAAVVGVPTASQAQYIGGSAPPPPAAPLAGYAESAEAALSRNLRLLAINARNYEALLGAGRAALKLGDPQAAVGFFGRAEEINPRSWVPKWGQGAAFVQMEDPQTALRNFADAQRLGANQASVALDRGLAYDLTGDQVRAQSDYRAALFGSEASEARRRLALSLAISGNRAEALKTLDPLLAKRDPGASRCRAFVLALTGDIEGARGAVRVALPGLAGTMDPFLRRLASLRPAEKAAAVNFGHIPGAGGAQIATTVVTPAPTTPQVGTRVDRLADIGAVLTPQGVTTTSQRPTNPAPAPPSVRVAANTALPTTAAARNASQPGATYSTKRYWVQLASGSDTAALTDQFRRIKARNRDALEGINGYVAEEPAKSRLLVGPFRNSDDAQIFADDLASLRLDAFSWISAPGQQIRKLPTQ